MLQGGRRASSWDRSAYQINIGLFSPCLPCQAGSQAQQGRVEETAHGLRHVFHSQVPKQLVGSHGAACTPVLGKSKEGRLAEAPLLQHPPTSGRWLGKQGKTTPDHHVLPEMGPSGISLEKLNKERLPSSVLPVFG